MEPVDVALIRIGGVLGDFLDEGLIEQPEHLLELGGVLSDPEIALATGVPRCGGL